MPILREDGLRSIWLPGSCPSSERLLAERFARSEIDEDDYRRRLAMLAGAPTGARPCPDPCPAAAGPMLAIEALNALKKYPWGV